MEANKSRMWIVGKRKQSDLGVRMNTSLNHENSLFNLLFIGNLLI